MDTLAQQFYSEVLSDKKRRARQILRILKKTYGNHIGPFITYSNPLELVVGIILSAQCTDARVNMITKSLFAKYKTATDYARADIRELEQEIYSAGFYRVKAQYLKNTGQIIDTEFGGKLPETVEGLLRLSGVSHKTAYLIMAKAFGKNVGVAVDTHVFRLTSRLVLSHQKDPTRMSVELSQLFPAKEYLNVNEYFVTHGRTICLSRKPQCAQCILRKLCPSRNF